jgi:hypothetical protein
VPCSNFRSDLPIHPRTESAVQACDAVRPVTYAARHWLGGLRAGLLVEQNARSADDRAGEVARGGLGWVALVREQRRPGAI